MWRTRFLLTVVSYILKFGAEFKFNEEKLTFYATFQYNFLNKIIAACVVDIDLGKKI